LLAKSHEIVNTFLSRPRLLTKTIVLSSIRFEAQAPWFQASRTRPTWLVAENCDFG